jgi:hypothetical protein
MTKLADNKPIGTILYRAADGCLVADWRGTKEEARQDTKDLEWKLGNIQTRKIHDIKQALIEALA